MPCFLVVEDDPLVARALRRLLKPIAPVEWAATASEGRKKLAHRKWTAVFLDEHLPDGRGLELLEEMRRRGDRAPTLMLTGSAEAPVINRAFDLDARFAVKPADGFRVTAFARRAVASAELPAEMLDSAIHEQAGEWRLSASETEVLAHAVHGHNREGIAASRGTTPETVKAQVREILKKARHRSMDEAVTVLLRRALTRAR